MEVIVKGQGKNRKRRIVNCSREAGIRSKRRMCVSLHPGMCVVVDGRTNIEGKKFKTRLKKIFAAVNRR